MSAKRVMVVSGQPLISEGLKLIIEESGVTQVAVVSDQSSVAGMMAKLAPNVIVVDRTELDDSEIDSNNDYPSKVVVISPNDDRMIVYSRQKVDTASLENLLATIQENEM